MIEWYRLAVSFADFMDETLELMRLLLGSLPGSLPRIQLTYKEAFQRYTGLDPFHAPLADLTEYLIDQGIRPYNLTSCMEIDLNESQYRDDLLNQILGLFIEPHLGWELGREVGQELEGEQKKRPSLTILSHYPATQAALARTTKQGEDIVAERFEVYCQGIELANGYHELTDAQEQESRFATTNQLRIALGKQPLPVDAFFLQALKQGLPDCCGVAVGFDRLMMLRHQKDAIGDVLPIARDKYKI